MSVRARSLLTASTVVACLACMAPTPSSAALLTVTVGVAGPELSGSGALGAYDVSLSFDPVRLLFQSLTFGDQLQLGDGSLRGEDSSVSGQVLATEVSFVDPVVLGASQADAFAIFSIVFDVLSGTPDQAFASVSLVQAVLGDALGDPLPVRLLTLSATPETQAPEVPEPATSALAGAGLAALLARRARHHVRCGR